MTLQNMLCFLTLAETLSYTQTAERLFISQPAVTKHVEALEKELNTVLINRENRRRIALTSSGRIFYQGLKNSQTFLNKAIHEIQFQANSKEIDLDFLQGTLLPRDISDIFMNNYSLSLLHCAYITKRRFQASLNRGAYVICPKEFLSCMQATEAKKLNASPIPYYLIANKEHSAFQYDIVQNPESFAYSPFFYIEDTPKELLDSMVSEIKKLTGSEPLYMVPVQSPDMIIQYLQVKQGITIASPWQLVYHTANTNAIQLSLFTDYYLCWDANCKNKEFAKALLNYLHLPG